MTFSEGMNRAIAALANSSVFLTSSAYLSRQTEHSSGPKGSQQGPIARWVKQNERPPGAGLCLMTCASNMSSSERKIPRWRFLIFLRGARAVPKAYSKRENICALE